MKGKKESMNEARAAQANGQGGGADREGNGGRDRTGHGVMQPARRGNVMRTIQSDFRTAVNGIAGVITGNPPPP